jgi:hypothetical protein
MVQLGLDLVRKSADLLRGLLTTLANSVAMQEFQNKLDCFRDFESAGRTLPTRPGARASLSDMVGRAATLGTYRALWMTEGLGYLYADQALKAGMCPSNLLTGAAANALPRGSLTSLHAGMGLAFANHLLGGLAPRARPLDVGRALRTFVTLCRGNAHEGHAEAALEALGLVTRNLYPSLVPVVDRQLSDWDGELTGYFWHGVGRGLYFSPTNFFPFYCGAWAGLAKARSEAPHALGRANAVSGLAWALTLVNIRHPGVLDLFLTRYGGLVEKAAFVNGLASALVIWWSWSANGSYLTALCQYQPTGGPIHDRRWQRMVGQPCVDAVSRYYPAVARSGQFGKLFRYRPLEELADLPSADR